MNLFDLIVDVQANGLPQGVTMQFEEIGIYKHGNHTFARVKLIGIMLMVGSTGHAAVTDEIHIPLDNTSEVHVNCSTITFTDNLVFDVSKNGRIWAVKQHFSELAKRHTTIR